MKRVLVFPCGSEIGLETLRALEFSTHFELVGGSSVDDHGKFVYKNYVDGIPQVDQMNFIEKINEVVKAQNIDFIIPAHDSAVLAFSRAAEEGKLAAKVIGSPLKTCEIACSKGKSYACFTGVIPVPQIFSSVEAIHPEDFPVFLKPDVGQGSKGTYVAQNKEEVKFYLQKDPSLLILEHLPGKEYTIDCFTDKEGALLFSEGRERTRIMNGISVSSIKVEDGRFAALAATINSTLKFRGVWFFQVKENRIGDLVLMEIAPRTAGTMALARCEGVNLPLLSLFDAMGYEVGILENNIHMIIDRALSNRYIHDFTYRHVYLDFDDLVIYEEKVNPSVMAFVYQCLNKDVKLHLITKHKGDLKDTLAKYRLTDTFDDIILIQGLEEKVAQITEKDAIFIDDSFAERKAVHETCKIPVFDSHMIESLMEVL